MSLTPTPPGAAGLAGAAGAAEPTAKYRRARRRGFAGGHATCRAATAPTGPARRPVALALEPRCRPGQRQQDRRRVRRTLPLLRRLAGCGGGAPALYFGPFCSRSRISSSPICSPWTCSAYFPQAQMSRGEAAASSRPAMRSRSSPEQRRGGEGRIVDLRRIGNDPVHHSLFQMNSTSSAPTVAPMNPAPWSSRYQPTAWPRWRRTHRRSRAGSSR